MNLHIKDETRFTVPSILLIIFLFFSFGCTPTAVELADTNDGGLLIDYPLGEVEIYLKNNTGLLFENVIINSGGVQVDVGTIEPRTTIGPFSVPYVYQLFAGSITVDGVVREIDISNTIEMSGEPPITSGSYTFDIEYFFGELTGFIQPNADISQARLAPLIELLEKEGREFRYEPSIQRGNVFNQGVGPQASTTEPSPDMPIKIFMPIVQKDKYLNRPIDSGKSATELFYLRDNTRLTVYIFADQATAEAASKQINLGTTTIQVTHEDGSVSTQSVYYWDGDQPVWWQFDNLILLTDGRDDYIYEQINNVVGGFPLGGPKPEFVPTPTPVTPVIDSDIYMARRNYDDEVCHQALLAGELVLDDNFLYVDSYFIVWPRLYSIVKFGEVPTVIGSNGEVVARVGDNVRFGGSSIPKGNTFWMENLVDPLPDRFENDESIWGMCGYSK